MLCVATMAAGVVHLRSSSGPAATAVRVGSADGFLPVENGGSPPPPAPSEAALGPISLADIVRQVKSRPTASTSTTRARPAATTTTVKRVAPSSSVPAATTTTTAAGATRAPATTTTVAGTPLTTLLEKVVPPAAAVTGVVTRSDSGVASWFRAPAATCAHRTLPMGTQIKVTRLHNGASTMCKVDDRGPTVETGRLIDLSLDTFEKLADREAGLIDVKIEW